MNLLITSLLTLFSFLGQSDPEPKIKETVLEANHRTPELLFRGRYKDSTSDVYNAKQIYKAVFNKKAFENEWEVEGPGVATFHKKTLTLNSELADDFIKAYGNHEFYWDPKNMRPYFKVLGGVALEKWGEAKAKEYYEKGEFKGGHIVAWNKKKLKENYVIEFDLKHESPMGLFILFFSADGMNGKDFFS